MPPLPRTAWLEIDLDALTSNLRAVRAAVAPGVRVEPVVKADAYGHGLVPVARALEAAGADGLSVAAFDEAVALRRAGLRCPILVLYPVPPELAGDAARRRIALTVGDPELLRRMLTTMAAERAKGTGGADGPAGRRRPLLHVQLEIETGLGRGGFALEAAVPAARSIARSAGVRLDAAWSHLAAAGDIARTAGQVALFDAALAGLADAGVSIARRHLAASGAIAAGRVPAYEAVRPGLAIYGLVPDGLLEGREPPALGAALRPVLSLHARPVRVLDLPAGWGISYGPSFETPRPSRIATLPLGYGDGWPRALSNSAEAIVRGLRVPLVGTVAMDAVMADVTDVPGPPVNVDDEFTLLGSQGSERIDARDVARSRTTISYEVVTAFAARLPRVYDAAAEPVGIRTLAAVEDRWPGSSSGTAISATSRSTRS